LPSRFFWPIFIVVKHRVIAWAVWVGMAGTAVPATRAQVCDPAQAPTGLSSGYSSGSGVLLQWDEVPGSVGVQLRATLPSGGSVSRRLQGSGLTQFFLPEHLLVDGTYTWSVQAACSVLPPYAVTPISETAQFVVGAACPASLSDVDGQVYSTVQVGAQCWMAENLRTTRYRNGDPIPGEVSNPDWEVTASGASAPYNNAASNTPLYGLLYNGHAVADPRGLCPAGWRVPSDDEWTSLISELDPSTCPSCTAAAYSSMAGGALRSTGTLEGVTGLWRAPNIGASNSSGFSAEPGGIRTHFGNYYTLGFLGYWWTSTPSSPDRAWIRILDNYTTQVYRNNENLQYGFSVRCLKD
jgi:uncharacterized protein (TIGR02145 family)